MKSKPLLTYYLIVDNLEHLRKALDRRYLWVQFRDKQNLPSTLAAAEKIIRSHRQLPEQKILLNDDPTAALEFGFDGVHLGQEDLLEKASALKTLRQHQLILGISTHSWAEIDLARQHHPDYLAFGPIFATANKPHLDSTGKLEMLSTVCREVAPTPVVAIGGIQASNVAQLATTGIMAAASIAWTKQLLE